MENSKYVAGICMPSTMADDFKKESKKMGMTMTSVLKALISQFLDDKKRNIDDKHTS